VRKVDMSIELQILAFHEQRKLYPSGVVGDLNGLARAVTP
jgi:hypothetical protein